MPAPWPPWALRALTAAYYDLLNYHPPVLDALERLGREPPCCRIALVETARHLHLPRTGVADLAHPLTLKHGPRGARRWQLLPPLGPTGEELYLIHHGTALRLCGEPEDRAPAPQTAAFFERVARRLFRRVHLGWTWMVMADIESEERGVVVATDALRRSVTRTAHRLGIRLPPAARAGQKNLDK